MELTEGQLRAAFVISRAIRNTKLGQEVTEALTEYALPILSVRVMQRVLYPTTAATGTTVLDVEPQGEAAKEIRALMHELKGMLN
jgi:chromosome partitioning protein